MSKIPKNLKTNTIIYVLKHPETGEVRYVGKTVKKLKYRLTQHVSDVKRTNTYKSNWIKSLIINNLYPLIEEIDSTSWDKSQELETYYILYYKSLGYNLCNHTLGGEGTLGRNHSKKQKEKMKLKMISKLKEVHKYTLTGEYVCTYINYREAANENNINWRNIFKCCNGTRKSANNFQWSYLKKDIIEPYCINRKKVYSSDKLKNNNFYQKRTKVLAQIEDKEIIFNSMKEASLYTGIAISGISLGCKYGKGNRKKIKFKYVK